ncbi:MAG: aminotransferase class IV [Gammaproteobacteria bacterium]|nr:aminotransferase class IV [Gammaproteobacteria bacterium]
MSNFENRHVFLNGELSLLKDARISVLDRGFLFGDGIYEVIPVYGGHIFHLKRHFIRLTRNLDAVRISVPFNINQLKDIIKQLIKGDEQESVYLQITRGVARRDHGFPEDVKPTVFVMANSVQQQTKHGVSLVTITDDRWQHCDIKTIALLPNVLLRQQAHDQSADEAILIRDGMVTEGAASNVFIVSENKIMTPQKSQLILPGVTRDILIELATDAGIQIIEGQISEQMLNQASEIWISSSTKEIVPAISLNHNTVSGGIAGPVWHQMNDLFQAHKLSVQGQRSG